MNERKTLMPDPVAGLTDLFEDLQIIRSERRVPDEFGGFHYATPVPAGYYFVGGLQESVTLEAQSCFLYGKPKDDIVCLTAPHLSNGELGSFDIIAWESAGKSLVVARSAHCYPGEPWVCFIQPIVRDVPTTLLSRDDRATSSAGR